VKETQGLVAVTQGLAAMIHQITGQAVVTEEDEHESNAPDAC
jgi:hypothetical protein